MGLDVIGESFGVDEGYRRLILLEEGVPDTRIRFRNPTKESFGNRRLLVEKPLESRSDSFYDIIVAAL